MARLLIVGEANDLRSVLDEGLLPGEHSVHTEHDERGAIDRLRKDRFDVVLIETGADDLESLELLRRIRMDRPKVPAILIVAADFAIESAVAAMKAGAVDCLRQPLSRAALEAAIARAAEMSRLRSPDRPSSDRASWDQAQDFPLLESRSRAMRRLLDTARQAAASNATILLTGESGTGKSMIARQIHLWSERYQNPFVVINCTNLSEHLLESELFGHMRGAFTDAVRDKPGRFETADGGTIFLDEIADISAPLQTKFLRFVQEQSFERVGSERTITVDARIIAASNRDIRQEVEAARFRQDLFYRLNVITLHVPALRERAADIVPLAKHFLWTLAERHQRQLSLSSEAAEIISRYRWPGNVRELRNALERAAVLVRGDEIGVELLPDAVLSASREPAPAPPSLDEVERRHILHVLAESARLEDAAAALGISVTTLWRKRRRYKTSPLATEEQISQAPISAPAPASVVPGIEYGEPRNSLSLREQAEFTRLESAPRERF